MQQVYSSGNVLTFAQLTLVIYTHCCNIDCILSIVVVPMEHHHGIWYIIITFLLLGEKYLEKFGVSPMTLCNIITLLSKSKPVELGLMQWFCKFGKTILQKGSPLSQSVGNIAIYETRSVFRMNYCEIRCKYDDDFNTAHVMVVQNCNDSWNYQKVQSVSVLKDMIGVRDCVKECAILITDDVMYIINDICLN